MSHHRQAHATHDASSRTRRHPVRTAARWGLAGALAFTGVGHLSFAREGFAVAVPDWMPSSKDATVLASGVVELALAAALASGVQRKQVGRATAAFFAAVFPGNVHQYVKHLDASFLNSDQRRLVRLYFQPLLVAWALEATRED
ncbi:MULTISPECIES: DoxX family protein [Propionibacterium]|nr:DoxX protein [Propionibacterium freudenreichii]MDK9332205.1 DoxX protein [Propionibacterium freudenreichii]MDK9339011.1 DoxX protein [Propionibacterium freudenreichii]MDK9347338.1 DoxX protein [Propionibacterium freudenreichii]MDK9348707.1 DoxX protein [Propionibacterium freudenreichii]MDK9353177.1 DoxX protein [Propionibacterium freudenreichii]